MKRTEQLAKRYDCAKTIKDTRQYHCVIPKNDNTIQVKLTSFDSHFEEKKMC